VKRGLPLALYRRLDPVQRYGVRLTLLVCAIALVAVPFSYLLFEVLAGGPLTRVDANLANRLNDAVHERDGLVGVLEAISWLGRPPALWVATGVAVVYTWRRGVHRLTIFLLATTIGGAVLSTTVKLLVDRPRPVVDHPIITAFGKSFPSGHALSSTVVYGAVLLTFLPLVPRRRRPFALAATVLLILAIGATRLLLGVHFLSDVLAGFILGTAWLVAATVAFEIWRVERGRPAVPPLREGVEPEAASALSGEPSA
jgi:undecaprenyl-diphosphatase